MSMNHVKGFSLLELMAVITVAGILMALGVPGMVTVVQNNRILATSNDFISAVHAGRMESIKRRSTVVLCASADPEAAVPSCSNDFSSGWIVFVDRDQDGQVDANPDPALDDTVLVARKLAGGNLSLAATGGDYLAFAPSGFATALPALGARAISLKICDDRGNVETTPGQSAARVVVLAGTGRPETLKTVSSITAYGGC